LLIGIAHTPVGGFRVFVLFMSRQPVFGRKLLFAEFALVGFGLGRGGISVSVIDKLIGHLQPLPNLDKPWLLGHSSQIFCLGFTDSGQAYKMTEGLVQE